MGSEGPGDPEKSAVATPETVKPLARKSELVFFDNHELVIDKHRMLLPSDIRRSIVPERDGEAFFIVIGINKKPWFYSERRYFELANELESDNLIGEDELEYLQMMFSQASRQAWDSQWRIGVPEKIRRKTNIGTVVTLAGVKDHLELWNRDDWTAHEAELDRKRLEIYKAQKAKKTIGRSQ